MLRSVSGAAGDPGVGERTYWSRWESGEVIVEALSRSTQYWYAQALADAVHRGRWIDVTPRRADHSNGPVLKSVAGGRRPKPRVLQAYAGALPRAGVRPATVLLGSTGYQLALGQMLPNELEAWWEWLAPKHNALGRRVRPTALYRSHGARVTQGDHSERAEQGAALAVLRQAAVRVCVP